MPILLAAIRSNVLLVSGQSNAVSAPRASELPSNLQTPDAGVKIWTGSAFATLANGVNNNPLYASGDGDNWGPEAEFSRQWRLANPSKTLYIVKTAQGGVPISSAILDGNGGTRSFDPTLTGNLFAETETHVANAFAALSGPSVIGMIWMQGEQDASASSSATAYGTNLTAFYTAARTRWKINGARIMMGRISTAWAFSTTVRAAQDAAVSSNVLEINTDSYGLRGDGVHYTATGIVSLGADSYAAWSS